MKTFLQIIFVLFLIGCNSESQNSKKAFSGNIDINSVSDSLLVFSPNYISTSLYERDMAINPEGSELIYTLGDYKQNRRFLIIIQKKQGFWGAPEIMAISGKFQDIEPFYAKNGNRLFFASNRPIYNDSTRSDYNIWYTDKAEGKWSKPVALDSIINTRGDEFYPSLSDNGNLYFTATRFEGQGREDIFIAEYENGKYKLPKPLPNEINTSLYEFNAYISPKEDIIIFSSFGREDGYGGGDLYLSVKDSLGKWSSSVNLGAGINSDKLDYCPFIDWNRRNFYFTSERQGQNINNRITNIERVKRMADSCLNGFGNIYKIGLGEIDQIMPMD